MQPVLGLIVAVGGMFAFTVPQFEAAAIGLPQVPEHVSLLLLGVGLTFVASRLRPRKN